MKDSNETTKASRKDLPLWKKTLFSALTLIGTFLLAELACRFTGIGARPAVADYIADWDVQWDGPFFVLQPAPQSGINGDGLRDRPHRIDNPRNRLRVVCLGDSVTFGHHVPFRFSYPAMLENLLARSGHWAEVFNMALPGWSTRQQRMAYHTIARKYKPDYVILGLCLNDIPEMQNNLTKPPYGLAFLVRHSNLFRCVVRAESREISRVEELFDEPQPERVQHAWRLCDDELRSLYREVHQDGVHFVLLVLPFRFQLDQNSPRPIPQARLREFAEKHHFDFVDVLPALAQAGSEVFIDYDHLSPLGAQIVARQLVESGIFEKE